jgi:hypothetical protein
MLDLYSIVFRCLENLDAFATCPDINITGGHDSEMMAIQVTDPRFDFGRGPNLSSNIRRASEGGISCSYPDIGDDIFGNACEHRRSQECSMCVRSRWHKVVISEEARRSAPCSGSDTGSAKDVNVGWSLKLSQHYHEPMNFLSRACRPFAIHKASNRNFHTTARMQGDYNVRVKGYLSADTRLTNHDRQPYRH